MSLSVKIQSDWGIGRAAADFLITRGLVHYEQLENIFNPLCDYHIYTPYIPNWFEALDKFTSGINARHKFGIFGDYDCDGTTSAAMFTRYLRARGISVVNQLASRSAGYGFHIEAAKRFVEAGCQTVITLDCGSNNTESLRYLEDEGIQCIVIDHHNITDNTSGHTVANPQLNEDIDESHTLCAGALSYLFLKDHGEVPAYFKTLAALATVADCSDTLSRINRAICVQGFSVDRKEMPAGLKYLLDEQAKPILTSNSAGWYVNPALNAAGRMNRERTALNLLLADEHHLAADALEDLLTTNKLRRAVQDRILKDINAGLDSDSAPVLFAGDNLIVISGDWPENGVLGVAASRVCHQHNKIAIISGSTGGSGRVPDRFDGEVFEEMNKVFTLAGHNKAFGAKLPESKEETVRLAAELDSKLHKYVLNDAKYDLVRSDYSNEEWYEFRGDLKKMDPFGKGFDLPIVKDDGIVDTFNPWRW